MGMYDSEAKSKYLLGAGYCCLSILEKCEKDWKCVCFGDGTHVGTGTTEIYKD